MKLYNSENNKADSELTIRLLEIINNSTSLENLISQANNLLHDFVKCEAIGIRLEMDGDYPYFETRGFPRKFVLAENHLCSKDKKGKILRDDQGDPLLECMCGNVIQGRFDPEKSFFTPNGSFWSNCTTELLATTTDEDRQTKTRNRCNGEGYESVALVPLKIGDQRFGLLQFNDKHRNQFDEETISFLEKVADYIAIALSHKRMEIRLKENEQRFRMVADFTYDWEYWIKPDGHFEYVSPSCIKYTACTPEQFIATPDLLAELIHPDDRKAFLAFQQSGFQSQDPAETEFRIVDQDNKVSWIGHKSQPVFSPEGDFLGLRCSNRDITASKKADLELRRNAEEKEILLREVNHRVKNNLSSILAMLHLEEKRLGCHVETETSELIRKLERRLKGFSLVHDLMSRKNWKSVKLDKLLRVLMEELVKTARKSIAIEYRISTSEITVNSHIAHHLSLVISELVSNSLKHAFTGKKPLRLTVNISEPSKRVCLEFKDNGPGFPQSVLINQGDNSQTGIELVFNIVLRTLDGEVILINDEGAAVRMEFEP